MTTGSPTFRVVDTLGFIGVTASASSINRVFPQWAKVLDLGPVRLEPLDLPLDCPPETYREVVADIRRDPRHRGALITSHKVRFFDATSDLFDDLDAHARHCAEISCVSKRDDRLIGHAKDPITAGRSLGEFVPPGHFAGTGAPVLCLGAGGAGLGISVALLVRPAGDRPTRIVLVDVDPERLVACRRAHERLAATSRCDVEYVVNGDPEINDRLLAALPAQALVINATGMGKDRPGSPLTDQARFPERGLVWELNYRGELDFLHQARRQAIERALTVEDGWRYFVHGWSEVVAEVFDLRLTPELVQQLSREASAVRS